jgi:hypothetical protein
MESVSKHTVKNYCVPFTMTGAGFNLKLSSLLRPKFHVISVCDDVILPAEQTCNHLPALNPVCSDSTTCQTAMSRTTSPRGISGLYESTFIHPSRVGSNESQKFLIRNSPCLSRAKAASLYLTLSSPNCPLGRLAGNHRRLA